MKRHKLFFALNFLWLSAYGQISPNDAKAICALLTDTRVANNIFFSYDQSDWKGAFQLPPGNYAFICPDTTFQKVYPDIIEEFPNTISTDGLLSMRTFYKDSIKGIFVNGSVGPRLQIVFKKIDVGTSNAVISFFTTSYRSKKFENKYVSVTGYLEKKDNQWVVGSCEVKRIEWIEYFKIRHVR